MGTTYRVTGQSRFKGHEPGELFEADLDEGLEARAIARGSITRDEKQELEDKSRTELDDIASGLGVDEPEKLGNKAEVIAAIRSHDDKE